jgi:hypothetical protein
MKTSSSADEALRRQRLLAASAQEQETAQLLHAQSLKSYGGGGGGGHAENDDLLDPEVEEQDDNKSLGSFVSMHSSPYSQLGSVRNLVLLDLEANNKALAAGGGHSSGFKRLFSVDWFLESFLVYMFAPLSIMYISTLRGVHYLKNMQLIGCNNGNAVRVFVIGLAYWAANAMFCLAIFRRYVLKASDHGIDAAALTSVILMNFFVLLRCGVQSLRIAMMVDSKKATILEHSFSDEETEGDDIISAWVGFANKEIINNEIQCGFHNLCVKRDEDFIFSVYGKDKIKMLKDYLQGAKFLGDDCKTKGYTIDENYALVSVKLLTVLRSRIMEHRGSFREELSSISLLEKMNWLVTGLLIAAGPPASRVEKFRSFTLGGHFSIQALTVLSAIVILYECFTFSLFTFRIVSYFLNIRKQLNTEIGTLLDFSNLQANFTLSWRISRNALAWLRLRQIIMRVGEGFKPRIFFIMDAYTVLFVATLVVWSSDPTIFGSTITLRSVIGLLLLVLFGHLSSFFLIESYMESQVESQLEELHNWSIRKNLEELPSMEQLKAQALSETKQMITSLDNKDGTMISTAQGFLKADSKSTSHRFLQIIPISYTSSFFFICLSLLAFGAVLFRSD